MEGFNTDDYVEPLIRDEKDLTIKKILGSVENRTPNRYRVGDKVVKGIELGDAPVGLGNQGVEKRNRFTLPGTNKLIRSYIKNGKKSGGSDPYAWDKDDLKGLDGLLISPKDLNNAETNDTFQRLKETYKDKRFAGKKLDIYWGDTDDSVQNRINMMQSVADKKRTEPDRVQDEIENAVILGEAQNSGIRSENQASRNDAFLKNKFFSMENERRANRQQDIDRLDDIEERNEKRYQENRRTENLRYEDRLRNELRREKQGLERDKRLYDFQIRQYEDQQDRYDREEKKEKKEAFVDLLGDVFTGLSGFF